jgi:dTDP-glucose pyrophosphorylase
MVGRSSSWRNACVSEQASIKELAENLNASGLKISLVVDNELHLLGTVSDGDLRRGLLRGLSLNDPVSQIMQIDPLVVPQGIDRVVVKELMSANKLQQIPEVDSENHLTDLHLWDEDEVSKSKTTIIVIMAGGKGTRLRPHTENCPKPMLPLNGKPMLAHIINQAQAQGFSNFSLAINYLGHMVEEYFGDGGEFGAQIDYIKEPSPMGTAGALSLVERVPTDPFVVINGDVITDIRFDDLLDFHLRQGAVATMAVRLHEWQHPYGVVQMDGLDIIGFEEKPVARTHINAGVYVLNPEALSFLRQDESCDMPELFLRIQSNQLRTVAYPMHEPWLDVGRPVDLLEAQNQDGN